MIFVTPNLFEANVTANAGKMNTTPRREKIPQLKTLVVVFEITNVIAPVCSGGSKWQRGQKGKRNRYSCSQAIKPYG